MRVSEAVNTRHSMRVFKPDPVPRADIEWIISTASSPARRPLKRKRENANAAQDDTKMEATVEQTPMITELSNQCQ